LLALSIGYGFLPDGAQHPLPTEFTTAIQTLYSYLYTMNTVWPVDTAITVFVLAIGLEIYIGLLWPFILSIIGWIGRIA